MSNLIKITEKQGNQLVDARLLYQELKVGGDFSFWIKRRIEKYDFQENRDYFIVKLDSPNFESQVSHGGLRHRTDYHITIGMAKELCLLQNNEIGKAYRKYLIEFEEKARKQLIAVPKPKTYNGIKCIHYTSWLIQNGYSLMSGQVRGRIRKYPEQFRKGKDGWYMSEAISEYFLNYKNAQQRVAQLPSVNPKWVPMFSKEELQEMIADKKNTSH
ncbi:antA/AntB antirepressor family protein [Riemerella columbipharyngis]|uniref:Phage anti-repressor protein n=1 Tax=Riemerella columbipharyngis TaxID=1071918 RepID=A0A1G7FBI1_9FLAO|nr:antA/AntB antirepressor family protein [Riemerella columbipharyngis]SDE73204.1 Phage anti-repressor protein [Riemerella columbipharyngis]